MLKLKLKTAKNPTEGGDCWHAERNNGQDQDKQNCQARSQFSLLILLMLPHYGRNLCGLPVVARLRRLQL